MTVTFKTIEQLIHEKDSFINCIPNNLGINLCSVRGIEYIRQDDHQLKSLRIEFSPSPKEDIGYNTSNLPFDEAIRALKKGLKVAREGWNGKGMYLILIQGYPVNGHLNPVKGRNHDVESAMHNLPDFYPDGSPNVPQGKPGQMLSHIVMKTAGDSAYWGKGYSDYVPWLASQTDILAEDWLIVE